MQPDPQPDLLSWRPTDPAEKPRDPWTEWAADNLADVEQVDPARLGETPAKFRRAKGDPRDYAKEWQVYVNSNPTIAEFIRCGALDRLMEGATRVSVAKLFEDVRAEKKVSINTSYAAAAGDWLCAIEPRLEKLIERRRRRTTR